MNKVAACKLILLSLSMAACGYERSTTVQIQGHNPPTFVLTGSGNLSEVIIYEPGYRGDLNDESHMIWEIRAERMPGKPVEEVRTVTYGEVPEGYKQVIPKDGESPPALLEGKRYKFWIVSSDAPTALGYFEMRGKQGVVVESWH